MNSTKLLIILCFVLYLSASVFGADRALVIGIEHYLNQNKCNAEMDNLSDGCVTPTYGGVADARAIENLLKTRFGFSATSIRTLTEGQAAAVNIRQQFQNWLIKGTQPGDRVFVFYSGHGSRVPDDGHDEEDGMDEVLAPYDVQSRPVMANFIRDDEINEWIAALSGRQIVMVFDSCHSGTISRTLNSKNPKFSKYLITEDAPRSRGGLVDTFSFQPKEAKSRDLSTVVDKYMENKTPNLVVISAAQAYQQAMWFDANGSQCNTDPDHPLYRGALAYLFQRIYEKENPTLSQLESELVSGMASMGKPGTNVLCPASTGYQVPELEYSDSAAKRTLWGGVGSSPASQTNWTQSPITALQNPLSDLKVELNVNVPNGSYRVDDDINYSVELGEAAYVYVLVFSTNDTATVIYPNPQNANNHLEKGDNPMPAALASLPLGKDVWIVIASKERIGNLEKVPADKVFTWKELFESVNVKELQTNLEKVAHSRGVVAGGQIKPADWQSASIVMTTLPK